jgi:hypothetical protein
MSLVEKPKTSLYPVPAPKSTDVVDQTVYTVKPEPEKLVIETYDLIPKGQDTVSQKSPVFDSLQNLMASLG